MLYENANGVRKSPLYDIGFGTFAARTCDRSTAALSYSLLLILPPPRQSSNTPELYEREQQINTASPGTGIQASVFVFASAPTWPSLAQPTSRQANFASTVHLLLFPQERKDVCSSVCYIRIPT